MKKVRNQINLTWNSTLIFVGNLNLPCSQGKDFVHLPIQALDTFLGQILLTVIVLANHVYLPINNKNKCLLKSFIKILHLEALITSHQGVIE